MKSTTVILKKDSDKKHSVLFKAETTSLGEQTQAHLDSIYVKRPFSDGVRRIRVTIEEIE
jgi:hypothetical protein